MCSCHSEKYVVHQKFYHDKDYYFVINSYGFFVKDNKTRNVLLIDSSSNGLYHSAASRVIEKIAFYGEKTTQDVWQARLGHPSFDVFRMVSNQRHLPVGEIDSNKICHICPIGKSCRLFFSNRTYHGQKPLEQLHPYL